MISGRMRHPVDVQQVIETRDAAGGVIRNWVTLGSVWASVEPLRGKEYIEAQQVAANVTHRVRMRWYDGLTTTHRILHGGRALNINAALNLDERNGVHELMCAEEV